MTIHYRPIRVEINLVALQQNLKQVKLFAPKSKILAVIKANGYGHGIVRVAKQLTAADGFGVASIDEAIQLRQNGFLHPIVLLEGVFSEQELSIVTHHRLEMVVHSFYQLELLESLVLTIKHTQLNIWIKIDTGMNRLGFKPDDIAKVIKRIDDLNLRLNKLINLNWLSHFASADSSASFTNQQIDLFSDVTKQLTGEKSLANSAGIALFPASHLDWIRPGIMLFGAGNQRKFLPEMKPVMSFYSQVISLKWIEKGDTVGYGQHWVASKKTLLAIVAAGYGDGYPRHAKSGTPVLIAGKIMPLVGWVSMDMINVDVTELAEVIDIGEEVTLWGKGLSVDKVAESADTIGYELLCSITERVPKIEVSNDE